MRLGIELDGDMFHMADLHAVEGDGRAYAQPVDGAVEHHNGPTGGGKGMKLSEQRYGRHTKQGSTQHKCTDRGLPFSHGVQVSLDAE
ncbi:hypothetical protein AA16373_0560 [Komagataeibacter swingsii DSM 16373]|nr:hypothetical protein AA16373_0560 [Komagataeibacter swingsii DSM 16373]